MIRSLKISAVISASLVFALTVAREASAVEACRLDPKGVVKKAKIDDAPNYFFRTFPVQNKISYNGDDVNYILDLDTGEKFRIPGPFDPVPLWDEKVMTIPTHSSGMEFYSIEALKAGVTTGQRVSELLGNYQSIGRLSSSRYRMAIAYGAPYVYEFRVIKVDATGVEVKSTAAEGQPSFKQLCPEIGNSLKLPMISKEGKYLAGMDMRDAAPVTKIWEIQADLSCKEVVNLRMPTGKVDFSFDGKKITFHMEKNPRADFFEYSGLGSSLDVYELDLTSLKIKPLTFNRKGNAYYPVYRQDGKIVYIEQYEDSTFGFVVADPKGAGEISLADLGAIQGFKKFYPLLALNFEIQSDILKAIGQSWYQECAGGNSGANEAKTIIVAKSLTRGQCAQVVEAKWEILGAGFAAQNLTKEMILNACSTLPPDSTGEPIITPPTPPQPAETEAAQALLNQKCAICHGVKIPVKNLEKMKSMASKRPENSMLVEVIRRIETDDEGERMPLGGSLSDEEKALVLKYLKSGL